MGIVAAVGAAAAIASGVQQVLGVVNKPRSVVCIVENHTDRALMRAGDHHDHGGYAVPSDSQIAPQTVDIFGSQSKGGSLFTGTEGWIGYNTQDGGLFFVHWNNPHIGGNSCHARAVEYGANLVLCYSSNEG